MTDFLNPARLRAWCTVLAAALALRAAATVAQAALHGGGIDVDLGSDFTCYWAAATLARHGMAASVYQPDLLSVAEHTARALPAAGFFPFYYPPTFLLLCLPLAWLPYWWALAAFLGVGLALLLPALRRLVPEGMGWLPILAFPGVLVTAGTGQNGFLSAACLAWFAVWADARPLLAGACLGALACKPQLAVCAPLALLVAGRWRSLFAAAATFAALSVVSLLLFGTAAWVAFLQHAHAASMAITGAMFDQAKIMSAFIAARLLGAGLSTAAGVQVIVAVAALAALWLFIRRRPGGVAEGGALAAVAMLVTPYVADYDLVCLAPALAVAAGRGARLGFQAWDKPVLLGAYVMPLLARGVARGTSLQIAPLAVAGLLWVLVRRRGVAA